MKTSRKRGRGITNEDVERLRRLVKETLFYREFFKPSNKEKIEDKLPESPSSARDD